MQTTTTVPEGLRLENQLCFPLYACAKEVVRRYREPLEPLGLTYTQYIVMMILWEYGNMTEGELGKIIHLESGTLTPLLKRLEKQGLINRSRLESNERKLYIELTDKGNEMKHEAETVPCAIRNHIPLGDHEIMQLRELLNKTITSMLETEEQGER